MTKKNQVFLNWINVLSDSLLIFLSLIFLSVFFSNPYEECVKVSYYIYLRQYAKDNNYEIYNEYIDVSRKT